MAIGLDGHTVSLTKNGYFKLVSLIKKYPSTEILNHLDEIKLDSTQARKMLAGDKNNVLPNAWDSVRKFDNASQYALLLVSIIYSHKDLIELFKNSTNLEMQGVIYRKDTDGKTYTNLAYALNEAGVATDFSAGSDKTSYDFTPILAKNEIGPLAKEILSGHLKNMGWFEPSSNEPFQRDFYEQLNSYELNKVLGLSFIQFQEWLEGKNVAKTISNISLFNTRKTIYFGAPGTGKSYKVKEILKEKGDRTKRITFHPEYDYASFIGGFKPISEKDPISGLDEIKYKFVPQIFTNIYIDAWQNEFQDYFLVIEEINRGNCAEIFGDTFQLLDEGYEITPSNELASHLEKELTEKGYNGFVNGKMQLPSNLSLLATMNTSDQSLFPMDSAFKRRWDWEYIPICYTPIDDFNKKNVSFDFKIDIADGNEYSWIKFIEKINLNHIKNNQSLGMDKCIGNYFMKPDTDKTISLNPFINKVIFYLWNDVFKDEENKVFEENTSYEDFFPMDIKGKTKIKELFDRIELKPIQNLEIKEDDAQLRQVAEDKEGLDS